MTTLLISQPHDRNCGFHFNPMIQCLLTCNFPRYQTRSPSGFMCVHMLMTTGLVLTPSGSSIMIHPRAPLAVGLSPHYQIVPPLPTWTFCPGYVNFGEKVIGRIREQLRKCPHTSSMLGLIIVKMMAPSEAKTNEEPLHPQVTAIG